MWYAVHWPFIDATYAAIESIVKAAHTKDTIGLDSIAPDGFAALTADRDRLSLSGKSGTYTLRVIESSTEYVKKVLGDAFSVAEPWDDEADYLEICAPPR